MLHRLLHRVQLPPYAEVARFEGKGNWAVKKYYQLPQCIFYKKKLKMIANELLHKNWGSILDFGAGFGIFEPELKRHARYVYSVNEGDPIDWRWKFDAIVCASSLEFCHLDFTVKNLRNMCKKNSVLIVASPMKSFLSGLYFKRIKDANVRHGHKEIKEVIARYFTIKKYKTWFGLYFLIVGAPK